MKWHIGRRFLLMLLLGVVAAGTAVSQSSLDPGKLPKNATFYLAWHGAPSADARKSNSLLALWDDPDFAPVRAAMLKGSEKTATAEHPKDDALSPEELAEFSGLLDNEFLAGYVANPNPRHEAKASATGAVPAVQQWNGMFLVYDQTGKEAVLAKLMMRAQKSEKEPSRISNIRIAGMPVTKIETGKSSTYFGQKGKYLVVAGDEGVFAQMSEWTAQTKSDIGGLGQNPAYREAQDILKGGIAEFFFRFPSVKDMTWDANPMGFRLQPLLQSLQLEAVHAVAGRISIEGAKTRLQGAVIGDVSPGTLFDIWGEGTAQPYSWNFVNGSTVSYTESQINFTGIYGLIRKSMQAVAKNGQASPMDFIDRAIATRLGMPTQDALGIFTGEVATLQNDRMLDPAKQVILLGIRKKPEALKVLRAGLANRIVSEHAEGDTTYLKVSQGGMDNSVGTASWDYYHLAVGSDAMLFAKRSESVREMFSSSKTAPSSALSVPQNWREVRAQFPEKVNGLSFTDFQKIDWAAAKERWRAENRKAIASARAHRKPGATAPPNAVEDTWSTLKPELFSRHLHFSAGASWKDAIGVHFDGWID